MGDIATTKDQRALDRQRVYEEALIRLREEKQMETLLAQASMDDAEKMAQFKARKEQEEHEKLNPYTNGKLLDQQFSAYKKKPLKRRSRASLH